MMWRKAYELLAAIKWELEVKQGAEQPDLEFARKSAVDLLRLIADHQYKVRELEGSRQ